ncbi:MAG: ATP-binding cassette domain-containing protein [Bacteroidales bacterium]|nr:ATP-binding cassette domain-containing protein [Bacteroidales bacterium]
MDKYKKILSYIFPYKSRVALNVFFNFLSVIFNVFSVTMIIPVLGILFETQPVVTERIPFEFTTEAIQNNFYFAISSLMIRFGNIQALIFMGLFAITTSFFKNGFKYLAMYHLAWLRNTVVKDIRNDLYKKSLKLPLSYHSNEKKGDLISRMTSDVQQIEHSIISSLEMIFREPITILVYLVTLLLISSQLTLVVLILLPISGFIIGRIGKTLRATALKGQNKLGVILSVLEETLSGIRVIKAFNAEGKMTDRFLSLNSFYTRIMTKMFRKQYLASPVSEFLGTAVVVIIIWYGGSLVLSAESSLSPQGFIAYLLIFAQIINPAKSFSTAYYNVLKGMASADRIDDVMKAKVTIDDKPDAKNIKEFNHAIEFRNVSFRYEKEIVLNDIDLIIPKGKTIALVGQSGAGKSTLVDLIPRFWDVTEGEILIDGINIKDVKINDLRALMGNVSQEAILFNDNFFNNIAFGEYKVPEEDVIRAARIANANEFIEKTPLGYYTNIGDRGNKLSGGQRQRLSIARAVLKNPPILILDEATSALDTESEKLVQEALTNVMKNRTAIVIAHRLSTVVNADLLCVIHEGKIVERGTHAELLDQDGYYRKLHNLQMFAE